MSAPRTEMVANLSYSHEIELHRQRDLSKQLEGENQRLRQLLQHTVDYLITNPANCSDGESMRIWLLDAIGTWQRRN